MKSAVALALAALAFAAAPEARAWGRVGHETVAIIARSYLRDDVREKVDAMLAADPDRLTAPDMVSRSTWADAYRATHPQTTNWHFVNTEIDAPDLAAACFGFPASTGPASAGPADDCVVNKINAFEAELKDPATTPEEKLLALKFLIHFVGDMHQPLHSADNHDRGGNCVRLTLGGPQPTNLHSYWDSGLIETWGESPSQLAVRLRSKISPFARWKWRRGAPEAWARQSFKAARRVTYTLGSKPGCEGETAPIPLPAGYDLKARPVIERQLKRAGVRLAKVLNRSLG